MKLKTLWTATLLTLNFAASASVVVDSGPNHRTIAQVHTFTNLTGERLTSTNCYIELGSALNYLQDGRWLPSRPMLVPVPGGALLTNAAYSATFKNNLSDAESATFVTPSGQVLRTRITGLSYFDSSTQQAVLLAETRQGCAGEISSSNRLVYARAFDDVAADVEYVLNSSGWAQNVIIRADIPQPSIYNLNPATTRLQILTEFFSAPEDAGGRLLVSADGLVDQVVRLGDMQVIKGKAFPLNEKNRKEKAVKISKLFKKLDNRHFLIEEMQYTNAQPFLKSLPVPDPGASNRKERHGKGENVLVALREHLKTPERQLADSKSIQLAANPLLTPPGFLCDYEVVQNITNFTFSGTLTYQIVSPIGLSGKVVFEGGSVIKGGIPGWPDYTEFAIHLNDPQPDIEFKSSAYKPIVFTSANDNSVGETITNSTGAPYPGDYLSALIYTYGPGVETHDLRISFATTALQFLGEETARVCHVQIVNCNQGVFFAAGSYLGNVLLSGTDVVFAGCAGSSYILGEHLTIDGGTLLSSEYPELEHTFRNTLFKDVVFPEYTLNRIFTRNVTADEFEQVGAGAFYLKGNSISRNMGAADIDANLRLSLKQKTTCAPMLLSNIVSTEDVVLLPQAQRDTDKLDAGYHYDPIDFICAWFAITNADPALDVSLALSNGVVVANFDETGIFLRNSVAFTSVGLPTCPNRFVDYRTVQEQPVKIGSYSYNSCCTPVLPVRGNTDSDSFTCRFTHFSRPAAPSWGGNNIIAMNYGFSVSSLDVQDCEFLNGDVQISYGVLNSAIFRNNLFENTDMFVWGTMPLEFANNTIRNRCFSFEKYTLSSWEIRDNIFSRVLVDELGDYEVNHHHNAYVNSTNAFFTPLDPIVDLVLTNLVWEKGPLGVFYVPTNSPVLDAGSCSSAGLAGLYHQTMTTNQVKDAGSPLDIGRHYVALGADGRALDLDGDGAPDYLEDWDGDTTVDAGEASWHSSRNGTTDVPGLTVYPPIK